MQATIHTKSIAVRLGALLASCAMTALMLGSQAGLSLHYTSRADEADTARQNVQLPVTAQAAPPRQPRQPG